MSNAVHALWATIAARPEQVAVVDASDHAVTYAELGAAVARYADALKQAGIQPGDRALLLVPNGVAFAIAAIAALACGAVLVLCEPGLGVAVQRARYQASGAKWLLVHPVVVAGETLPLLRRGLAAIDLELPPIPPAAQATRLLVRAGALLSGLTGAKVVPDCTITERAPSNDALVIYTGGTLAAPKGVRVTHGAAAHYLGNIAGVIAELTVTRFLADTPQQVLYALWLGRTAYTTRGRQRRRADLVQRRVLAGDIDAYFGAPYLWQTLLARRKPGDPPFPSSLRTVLLGSAPVTPAFLRELRAALHPDTALRVLYGLTEAGPVCVVDGDRKARWSGDGDLVGAPIPGVDLSLDADVPEAGPGMGEVLVHSQALTAGYLGQPPRAPEEPVRTGDLGRLVDVDGATMLALIGRRKDMILRRGVNLYPSLWERALRGLTDARGAPLVRDCAVVGVWDAAAHDERVVLVLACDADAVPTIRAQLPAIMGEEGQPDAVLRRDALPVVGRQNKLDKGALRDWARAQLPADVPAIPFDRDGLNAKLTALRGAPDVPARVLRRERALRLGVNWFNQRWWALDGPLVAPPSAPPVLLLGHQRSGTTLLHRALAADPRARSLTLAEMLFPSDALHRRLAQVAAIDRRLGRPLQHLLTRWQDRSFAQLDALHRIRLDEPEEHEFLLWTTYVSRMCVHDGPYTAGHPALVELGRFERLPVAEQGALMAFVATCSARKLAREPAENGELPYIVAKSPAFAYQLDAMARAFPQARWLWLKRDPADAIASRLRLIQAVWDHRHPGAPAMTSAQRAALIGESLDAYRQAHAIANGWPAERVLAVPYAELIADPPAMVARIYDHHRLGPVPAEVLAVLARADEQRTRLPKATLTDAEQARVAAAIASSADVSA